MTRRQYVILAEYGGITPKCAVQNCANDAIFSFSEFGKFCSSKCRANSQAHLDKSSKTLTKAATDAAKFKRDHSGYTKYELALFSNERFKKLGFIHNKIVNLNHENVFVRERNNWVVVDFIYDNLRLIIEIDGDGHIESKDELRDDRLQALGYQVLRFSNGEVTSNIDLVVDAIINKVEDIVRHRLETGGARINSVHN